MPAPLLRALSPADAPAYRALRLAGISELPHAFCTTHALESSLPLGQISQRLQHTPLQRIFGVFNDTQLIAMAALRREPIALVHDKATIWGVYVAPQARGQGLARQLMQAIIAHACAIPELARLRLAVAHDNHAALALYLGCGFVLDDGATQGDMLQLQLLLPRPALNTAGAPTFLKINNLQFPAK